MPRTSPKKSKAQRLKLPNMNEFSPGVVGALGPLLELVAKKAGDRREIVQAIAQEYPSIRKTLGKQRNNRANNVLIGMSQCGLFDLKSNHLTTLGLELANETDADRRHLRFATQLLRECHGIDLLDAVAAIRKRHGGVSLRAIREELRARGFLVTENEGNASKIRQWLEPSGVVDKRWNVDDTRFKEAAGIAPDALDDWTQLSRGQRAFVLTVRQIGAATPSGWLDGAHVKRLCEEQWGPGALPEGAVRAKVIDPLVEQGWIVAEGKGPGRGGKIGRVRPRAKLLEVERPLELPGGVGGIPRDLVKKMSMPMDEIYEDLDSDNTHRKGVALELLALRIIRDLALRPVAFRLRSKETSGAEVDLLADGVHLHYSRWLFQCKNVLRVDLADLAKEVGMATLLKGHVVVLVTTGTFRKTVADYARGLAETTPLQAVLIDKAVLDTYRKQGAVSLVDSLRKQAEDVLTAKRPQVLDLLDGS